MAAVGLQKEENRNIYKIESMEFSNRMDVYLK